jgi:2-C-methyl-D-erythritol 2,4-cyclodiphosphate synthase/2-C-methyl-D-erythritol 4-phosphate cytidylyltransferase
MITAIIAAAGKGERAKQEKNKIYCTVGKKTLLQLSTAPFYRNPRVDEVILVIRPEHEEETKAVIAALHEETEITYKPLRYVFGGQTRTDSVRNALNACSADIVMIHDGARPYVSDELIDRCIDETVKYGSAVPVIRPIDTMSACDKDGRLQYTLPRGHLCSVQTPQCFFLSEILTAYDKIREGEVFTDDASVYSKYVMPAKTCDGEYENKKLTYKTDFDHEELSRTGIGYDTHQLVEGRKLILGGVEIPHEKGLLGHSDADVLIHAVMDALLTAAGLPDIGHLFPDTDPKYKDIASTLLLSRVMEKIEDEGYKVVNVSAVIMAEKPKLAPYLDKIIHNLSQIIHISTSAVGISCTTTEKLGFVGREEGIASCATVLLRPER